MLPIDCLQGRKGLFFCLIFQKGTTCHKYNNEMYKYKLSQVWGHNSLQINNSQQEYDYKNLPLLVCWEPLRICKSFTVPCLENREETSASETFFGSIPTKSLCSGQHRWQKVTYWSTWNYSVAQGRHLQKQHQIKNKKWHSYIQKGTRLRMNYVIKQWKYITPSLSNSPSAYFTCNGLDAWIGQKEQNIF